MVRVYGLGVGESKTDKNCGSSSCRALGFTLNPKPCSSSCRPLGFKKGRNPKP